MPEKKLPLTRERKRERERCDEKFSSLIARGVNGELVKWEKSLNE